jgi:hypothetical protein
MKAILALFLMLPALSAEEGMIFRDPRSFAPRMVIRKGERVDPVNTIQQALLVIHWFPTPDGGREEYQISGIDGYHSRERVERFLSAFYALPGNDAPPLIVAGNNWGAGSVLVSTMGKLSKTKGFDIYLWSDRNFKQAALAPEPADRLAMIRKAFGMP